MKRLKIFLRLKADEITGWLAECRVVIVAGGGAVLSVMGMVYIEWLASQGIPWAITINAVFTAVFISFAVVLILGIVIAVMWTFLAWLRDNWIEAGRIAERDEGRG